MGINIEINSDKTYHVDFNLPPGVNALDAIRILGNVAAKYISTVYPPELQAKATQQVIGELTNGEFNG